MEKKEEKKVTPVSAASLRPARAGSLGKSAGDAAKATTLRESSPTSPLKFEPIVFPVLFRAYLLLLQCGERCGLQDCRFSLQDGVPCAGAEGLCVQSCAQSVSEGNLASVVNVCDRGDAAASCPGTPAACEPAKRGIDFGYHPSLFCSNAAPVASSCD